MLTTRDLAFEVWSSADHLDEAAELLQTRHAIHRAAHPELPELGPEWSRQLLSACVDGAGFVARRGGRVVGYLNATAITEGPRAGFAWCDLNDHAAVDAETTRSLYAYAADRWVSAGLRQHVVHVPALDAMLWPWFLSTFGVQHTWSLRDTTPLPAAAGAAPIVVRRIGPEEALTAGKADLELNAHLRQSPVFSPFPSPTLEDAIQEQREFIEEPDVFAIVAERDGTHLGYGEMTTDPKRDLRGPADSAIFGIVVVDAAARGSGVGRTLTSALVDEARRRGHQHVICDWSAGNLQSSRAFTSFGWRPTFYRLYRNIPKI